MDKVKYRLRYFHETKYIILPLFILYLIQFVMNAIFSEEAILVFSREEGENLFQNIHWLLIYLTPCLLPLNYFNDQLTDLNIFEMVRKDMKGKHFWQVMSSLFIFVMTYCIISILLALILSHTHYPLEAWTIFLIEFVCVIATLLLIGVIVSLVFRTNISFLIILVMIILSFYADHGAILLPTYPSEMVNFQSLLTRIILLVIALLVTYVIFKRYELYGKKG